MVILISYLILMQRMYNGFGSGFGNFGLGNCGFGNSGIYDGLDGLVGGCYQKENKEEMLKCQKNIIIKMNVAAAVSHVVHKTTITTMVDAAEKAA